MREIKFRSWDEDYEVMHYGRQFAVALDGELRFLEASPMDYTLRGQTLMQFTGLRDKNGKEIYEGDVVKNHYDCWDTQNNHVVAIEIDGISLSGILLANALTHPLEVIGNIHENPELVK